MANLLIFQRLIPVLSLRTLATSSRGLKKYYPWSDYLEKLPDPSINYNSGDDPQILSFARNRPSKFMDIRSVCPCIFNNNAIKKDQHSICIRQNFVEF